MYEWQVKGDVRKPGMRCSLGRKRQVYKNHDLAIGRRDETNRMRKEKKTNEQTDIQTQRGGEMKENGRMEAREK